VGKTERDRKLSPPGTVAGSEPDAEPDAGSAPTGPLAPPETGSETAAIQPVDDAAPGVTDVPPRGPRPPAPPRTRPATAPEAPPPAPAPPEVRVPRPAARSHGAAPPATGARRADVPDRPSGAVQPATAGGAGAPKVGRTMPTAGEPPAHLKAAVAEVEAARARLGHDLEHLDREVRAQIGYSVERILWKVAAAGAAVAAAVLVRKGLVAGWRAVRKSEPPTNPAARSTGWGEALAWTAASGVGMAVAKVVATRGAAAGWEKATGSPPPEA
jgi:hypothetical protein